MATSGTKISDDVSGVGTSEPHSFDKLCEILSTAAEADLDNETQEQVGHLTTLLPYIKRMENKNLERAVLAAKFLLAGKPKNVAARLIIDEITPTKRAPTVRVVMGLGIFVYIAGTIILMISMSGKEIPELVLGINLRTMMIVAFFGGLGSVVSMMSRISNFSDFADEDKFSPYFAGLFRPIIGISFALFIFSAIEAGIITINLDESKKIYFIIALSFVSGFSERFAQDVITRIEGTYGRPIGEKRVPKGRESRKD